MGQHHHTHRHSEKKIADLPHAVVEALRNAMQREGVPDDWFEDLVWIMAQQSEGFVDAENPTSTARGLFQLTEVDYPLLPLGRASFGNAVEECQGGIRYIRLRYHTAALARACWHMDHCF